MKLLISLFAGSLSISLLLTATSGVAQTSDLVVGPQRRLGNGVAFTWVRVDSKTRKPIAVGVSMPPAALKGLPAARDLDPKMPMFEVVLSLPTQIKGLPYDHVGLDWNPVGHPPLQIYGVPHFDVHFYTISTRDQMAIPLPTKKNLTTFRKPLDEGCMAPGYILPPDVEVPMMGSHWLDPKSPELNGHPFTSTFIYGSYNGKLAFLEPMVALSFLKTNPDFSKKIAVPARVAKPGYYPSTYRVRFDTKAKEYQVVLDDLAYRKS